MMDEAQRILQARMSSKVRRFHTCIVARDESVGEHSLNVINLVLILTNGQASRELLIAAAVHDMGEAMTGDVPSPVKRMLGEEVSTALSNMEERAIQRIHPYLVQHELSEEEAQILKTADNLDGLLKCLEELMMGNRHIVGVGLNYCQYLMNQLDSSYLVGYFVTLFHEEAKRYV